MQSRFTAEHPWQGFIECQCRSRVRAEGTPAGGPFPSRSLISSLYTSSMLACKQELSCQVAYSDGTPYSNSNHDELPLL